MKAIFIGAVLVSALTMMPVAADAKGCIKGAIAGGVAGHFTHHALTGAVAGCIAGHYAAKLHQRAGQQGEVPEPGPAPAR